MELILDGGSIVDQRFEIIEQVGSGGMGSVFRAKQIGLEREVAVKVLQGQLLEDDEFRQRFEREAQALSQLTHKNIGAFYSYGIWKDQIPYIAMEFLKGQSLQELLQNEGAIDWRRACQIISQICDAMQYAHNGGIIHRDLKPSNIILLDGDYVKVMDFGLSRLNSAITDSNKLTKTGFLIGSVDYMSPEQCAGHAADNRSDIYSLSCMFYECVTGQPPHEADTPIGLLHKHANEEIIPASERLGRKLPAGLDELLLKGMAKDPEHRYQSMDEMRKDIVDVSAGTGGRIRLPAELKKKREGGTKKVTLTILFALLLAFGIAGLIVERLQQKRVERIQSRDDRPQMADQEARNLLDAALADFGNGELKKSMEAIEKVLAKKTSPKQTLRALQYHAIVDTTNRNQKQAALYWRKGLDLCVQQLSHQSQNSEWLDYAIDLRASYTCALIALGEFDAAENQLNELEDACRHRRTDLTTQKRLLETKVDFFVAKNDATEALKFCTAVAKRHRSDVIGLQALQNKMKVAGLLKEHSRDEYLKAEREFLQRLQRTPSGHISNILDMVGASANEADALNVLTQVKQIRQRNGSWTVSDECALLMVKLKPHMFYGKSLSKEQVAEFSKQFLDTLKATPPEALSDSSISVPVIAELMSCNLQTLGEARARSFLMEVDKLLRNASSTTQEQQAHIRIEMELINPAKTTASGTSRLLAIVKDDSLPNNLRALATYVLGSSSLEKNDAKKALGYFQKGVDILSANRNAGITRSILLRSIGRTYERMNLQEKSDAYYVDALKVFISARPAGADPAAWKQVGVTQTKENFLAGNKHQGLLKKFEQISSY